jgi:hypothetical protein
LAIVVGFGVIALQYLVYPPEFPPPPEPCDSSAIGSRDYSIYRALLKKNTSQPRLMDGATIFIPETAEVSDIYLSHEDFSVEALPKEILEKGKDVVLSKDAVANFLRVSPEITALDREQFAGLPLVLSSRAEVDDVFENKGGWEALGASTIVRFSRIGYSCDGNQALLYRSQSCGGLCGSGDLVILEKKGDKWQVVLTRMLWIS